MLTVHQVHYSQSKKHSSEMIVTVKSPAHSHTHDPMNSYVTAGSSHAWIPCWGNNLTHFCHLCWHLPEKRAALTSINIKDR